MTRIHAEAPLLMRETPTTRGRGACVHLVGGAAGPLGGDELDLCVDVASGAHLTIRSVAASLAQPGAIARASAAAIRVTVGAEAGLDWWPEPLISVQGSDHVMTTDVDLAASSTMRWVDEVCLGRAREAGGTLLVRQRVRVDGVPLAVHDLRFVPEVSSGVHGSARVAITGIVSGRTSLSSETILDEGLRVARFPVDERTTAWIALGDHHEQLRAALARLGLDRQQPHD